MVIFEQLPEYQFVLDVKEELGKLMARTTKARHEIFKRGFTIYQEMLVSASTEQTFSTRRKSGSIEMSSCNTTDKLIICPVGRKVG